MSLTAVIQPDHSARKVPELGMTCNGRDVPKSEQLGKKAQWFLVGIAGFDGCGSLARDDGKLTSGHQTSALGMAATGIDNGYLVMLVAPPEKSQPKIWISAPLKDLTVTTEGTQGLFAKRPKTISIASPEWELTLGEVAKASFDPQHGYRQMKKEAKLVEALGA